MRWRRGSGSVIGWNVSSPTSSSTAATVTPPRGELDRATRSSGAGRRSVRLPIRGRGRRPSGSVAAASRSSMYGGSGISPMSSSRTGVQEHNLERVAGRRAGQDRRRRLPCSSTASRRCAAGGPGARAPPTTPVGAPGSSSSTSAAPPVARRSRSRAGSTRVSLTTRTSPGAAGREVGHAAVLGRRAPPVDQQTGRVAGLDRHLGDARRRQVVVEVVQPHPRQATDASAAVCHVLGRDDDRATAG